MRIRVGDDFSDEFPGADPLSVEAAATMVTTATAFLDEVHRRRHPVARLSHSGYQLLSILEGAGEPLPSHTIAERMLVSTASMSSLLDTLERRGLVARIPHPTDRRKILVELLEPAQDVVDRSLPEVHAAATDAFNVLSERERDTLADLLGRVRARVSELKTEVPRSPEPRHRRS